MSRLRALSLLSLLLLAANAGWAHRVMDYQGQVLLQRKQSQGWAAPQPLRRRGVAVVSDDRLEVKGGSLALVRCASRDIPLWRVPAETGGPVPVSRGCGAEAILRLARRLEGVAGGADARLPYLLGPRSSVVAGEAVPLRWHAPPGVSAVQVWLVRQRDRQLVWGQRVSHGTGTVVPAGVGLTPGETYLVVLEADDGSSSQWSQGADQQVFRLASREERQRLEVQLAQLPAERGDGEAAALLRADALRANGFVADAINLLEQALRRQPGSLALTLELGNLYNVVGLNPLAAERYRQAASLARRGGDADALAEAEAGASRARDLLQAPQP